MSQWSAVVKLPHLLWQVGTTAEAQSSKPMAFYQVVFVHLILDTLTRTAQFFFCNQEYSKQNSSCTKKRKSHLSEECIILISIKGLDLGVYSGHQLLFGVNVLYSNIVRSIPTLQRIINNFTCNISEVEFMARVSCDVFN